MNRHSVVTFLLISVSCANAFHHMTSVPLKTLFSSSEDAEESLSKKMEAWEATEEEKKAATLGGLIPGSTGTDSFDIGLYIAFPPLFLSLMLFLFFPLLRDTIDLGDLSPPQA